MKTIIFDMDGVLVDSEPFHCDAWIETYKEIGIDINKDYYFTNVCGLHGTISTARVLDDFGKEADKDALIRKKEEIVCKNVKGNIMPVTGVVKAVKGLQENNYKLALASSSSFISANSILSEIGLKEVFSVIHTGETVKKGKPYPDIYLKTAKLLGVDPSLCVVIEDTSSGVLSAKKAGMKVIGVLNGRNSCEGLKHADVIVKGFRLITPSLIEQL